ncbi:MAG: hypothetical protein ACREEC_08110, partial [Thermoplasmata archaeon]
MLDGPSYIHTHIQQFANVTDGDVAALEWASSGLPGCSHVFIAPGSAAQYLPEYATVAVDFPTYPPSHNLSYTNALAAFLAGEYNASVKADLVALQINAVFVTGQTSVEFPAMNPGVFHSSTDFSLLFNSQDASVYAFVPVASNGTC